MRWGEFAKQFTEGVTKTIGDISLICDRDAIVSVGGVSRKEYVDQPISKEVEQVMTSRKPLICTKRSQCVH